MQENVQELISQNTRGGGEGGGGARWERNELRIENFDKSVCTETYILELVNITLQYFTAAD